MRATWLGRRLRPGSDRIADRAWDAAVVLLAGFGLSLGQGAAEWMRAVAILVVVGLVLDLLALAVIRFARGRTG